MAKGEVLKQYWAYAKAEKEAGKVPKGKKEWFADRREGNLPKAE